jgi:hypothetical protein
MNSHEKDDIPSETVLRLVIGVGRRAEKLVDDALGDVDDDFFDGAHNVLALFGGRRLVRLIVVRRLSSLWKANF